MAFEAFRAEGKARAPSWRRRLIYAVSVLVHGVLIGAGVAYSFWHVEELSPPMLRVTFLASAPPPPPPPPPAGGGGPARKKAPVKPKTVVQPKIAELVQPRETPKEEPKREPKPKDEAGEKDGLKGGVAGGTVGGTVGGTLGGKPGGVVGGTPGGAGTAAPKFLPPNLGADQKLSGEMPAFPVALRRPGAVYRVLTKIWVTANGTVDKVQILKGADPQLDENVRTTVKTWRFRPLVAGGLPIPFVYVFTFDFKTE
jgi:periplasmic protein TonB